LANVHTARLISHENMGKGAHGGADCRIRAYMKQMRAIDAV